MQIKGWINEQLCQEVRTELSTLKGANKSKKQRVRMMTLCELDKLVEIKNLN